MEIVHVASAVIRDKNKIFATQKGYGEWKGWWEFPGGKLEDSETAKEALLREIQEELQTVIEIGELIEVVEYDYPNFHLSMECFWAKVIEGNLILKEAQDSRWLSANEFDQVNWLPANLDLVEMIKKQLLSPEKEEYPK